MRSSQELSPVKEALRAYGDAAFDGKKFNVLKHLVERASELLGEFYVGIDEFKSIVNELVEETGGRFPSVIIIEVFAPKVPILDDFGSPSLN